jgi:outer membrane protein TolC
MLKSYLLAALLLILFLADAPAQDHSLDYYLLKGLSNSPLLKDYDNQLRSGSIDSLLVLCGYKPQVNLTSQVLVPPYSTHFGYDESITNGGNYAAVIGVKQPLIYNKVKAAQLQNIVLLKQSLAVNRKVTETDLKKSITTQYVTSFTDYGQLQFILKVIEMLTGQQKMVRYLVESGIYQQTDLMNLSATIKAQEIAYKQTRMQYKNDIAVLNLLCGIVDTATVVFKTPDINLTNRFDLNSLPAIQQSRIDSLRNSNAKVLTDLNYRPKLDAFADAGFMAAKPLNIPNNFGTSFGLNLSMPIYDGKQRIQEYKKIEIAENTRVLNREFYSSQYWQQYRQLQEQLHLTDDLLLEINTQIDQYNKLIEMYKIEIEKGLVRFTDFLSAINNYTNAQNNLAVARMNRMQIINQLNYLK